MLQIGAERKRERERDHFHGAMSLCPNYQVTGYGVCVCVCVKEEQFEWMDGCDKKEGREDEVSRSTKTGKKKKRIDALE